MRDEEIVYSLSKDNEISRKRGYIAQSTMHRLHKFKLEEQYIDYVDDRIIKIMQELVDDYNNEKNGDLKKEKRLRMLYNNPCGFRLTARMTTNYRQLKTIVTHRASHTLPEWQEFCRTVMDFPRFFDLCFSSVEE